MAQIYVRERSPAVERPFQELKAFRKVKLAPGEKLVQFILLPVVYADVAETTEDECFAGKVTTRGEGKFGSTDHV